jgi:hypothetical protein
MPWAAPRKDWKGRDWAASWYAQLSNLMSLDTVDFVLPSICTAGTVLTIRQPVRPCKYFDALCAFRVCIRLAGIAGDPSVFSLHSPRFFLPSVAGQMRLPLEEKRSLGRWGPNSSMPLKYDQAHCVTELLLKQDILGRLATGFVPAAPFELPEIPPSGRSAGSPAAKRASKQKGRPALCCKAVRNLVLNTSTKTLHLEHDEVEGKCLCSFRWADAKSHVERTPGSRDEFGEYAACPICWGKPPPDDTDLARSESSSAGDSGCTSTSDSSS